MFCYIKKTFVTMPLSLLCHFTSVPMGGIVSRFDCMNSLEVGIAAPSLRFFVIIKLFCTIIAVSFSNDKFYTKLYCYFSFMILPLSVSFIFILSNGIKTCGARTKWYICDVVNPPLALAFSSQAQRKLHYCLSSYDDKQNRFILYFIKFTKPGRLL